MHCARRCSMRTIHTVTIKRAGRFWEIHWTWRDAWDSTHKTTTRVASSLLYSRNSLTWVLEAKSQTKSTPWTPGLTSTSDRKTCFQRSMTSPNGSSKNKRQLTIVTTCLRVSAKIWDYQSQLRRPKRVKSKEWRQVGSNSRISVQPWPRKRKRKKQRSSPMPTWNKRTRRHGFISKSSLASMMTSHASTFTSRRQKLKRMWSCWIQDFTWWCSHARRSSNLRL